MLEKFDESVKQSLQSICNMKVEEKVWVQATLPTSMGGLGIRKSSDLTKSALLSSSFTTRYLVYLLPHGEPGSDTHSQG